MNFIEEYKKGQTGGNKGLPMGEGLLNVTKAINGVQRARIYGLFGLVLWLWPGRQWQ